MKVRRDRRRLSLFAALAWLVPITGSVAFANGVELESLGSEIPSLFFAARDGFSVRDLDGDGRDDFAFSAHAGYSRLLIVVGMNAADQIEVKQSLVVPGESLVAVMAASGAVPAETIYTLSHLTAFRGRLMAYGGWPLKPLRGFELAGVPRKAVIGDVNADGMDELIASFDDYELRSYSLATGQLLWQTRTQWPASELALVQLDADAALEIVVGNSRNIVDGATGADQGGPSGGFADRVMAARSGPGGALQIVTAGWDLGVVGAEAPWPWLWTHKSQYGVGALGVYDLDRDGRDEIVYGDAQLWASLHFLDGETQQERYTIQTYDYCICAVAQGDLDGDGYQDLGLAEGSLDGNGRRTRARWVDLRRGRWTFALESLDGRFTNVAIGDVDGDGIPEQVFASESDRLETTVRIHDVQSGQLEWQSPEVPWQPDSPFSLSANGVLLMPVGARSDIAVYGYGSSDSRLSVIDGSTHETRWQLDGRQEPFASRVIEHAVAFDYDGDGVADIAVSLAMPFSPDQPALIAVLSGTTGQLLAASQPIGNTGGSVVGMEFLKATPRSPPALLLASSESLHVVDAHSLQPLSALPVGASGLHLLPSPVEGSPDSLMTFTTGGQISFYDSRTLTHLRSISTGMPLDAILPLGDASKPLLAAAEGRLHVLDTGTGRTLATSDWLGTRLAPRNQLAASGIGPDEWVISVGGDAGHFRYRLRLIEAVFSDGFEPAGK